ncbi:penicillin-binding protein 2 [Candidatus Daviesbacteria bacterium]|nr:penicillin-binding protein 2 [Candidatus Daviesbacteria bacterium]
MWRIKFLFFAIVVVGFLIIARLFFWQVLSQDKLQARAEQQHWFIREIGASRGEIFDRNGAKLVGNDLAFLVYANLPALVESQKAEIARVLAPVVYQGNEATASAVDLPASKNFQEEILAKLNQSNLIWVPLARKISQQSKKTIESYNFDGINFEQDNQRFYPEASMAAQLLGFVGSDQDGRDRGYFGLEGFYHQDLKGKPGEVQQERDARGRPILIGGYKIGQAEDGRNLQLYLDRTIQYFAEKHLAAGVLRYGAKSGSVVVVDPQTGGILAMASYPAYDPLNFTKYPAVLYKNPLVADTYEPGSTFKVFIMSAALQESLVKPDTICPICHGPKKIGEYAVRTWDNKYRANSTMADVIIHSDNVGMTHVADLLGLDRLYKYIENFGFGQLTGIDLQDEAAAQLRPKSDWYPIDVATASFGQGVAVTAIQMVSAVSTLANGGKLMEPHVVEKIIGRDKTIEIKPKIIRQILRPETTKQVTEIMVQAVEKGEAKWTRLSGFRIAGKTGTAQIPIAGHYDPKKTIASFVGFAPADQARFVMLVRYDEPTSSPYGAETAAPTFFAIARDILGYLNIAPQ